MRRATRNRPIRAARREANFTRHSHRMTTIPTYIPKGEDGYEYIGHRLVLNRGTYHSAPPHFDKLMSSVSHLDLTHASNEAMAAWRNA